MHRGGSWARACLPLSPTMDDSSLRLALVLLLPVVAVYIATLLYGSATGGERRRLVPLFAGGCLLGLALWSMHFGALLAWQIPLDSVHPRLIPASLLLLCLMSCIGLALTLRWRSAVALAVAGVLLGAAIYVLHLAALGPERAAPSALALVAAAIAALLLAVMQQARSGRSLGWNLGAALLAGALLLNFHHSALANVWALSAGTEAATAFLPINILPPALALFLAGALLLSSEAHAGLAASSAALVTAADANTAEAEAELPPDPRLEQMAEALLYVDSSGICTYANAAAAGLLGCRADELTGRHLHSRLHATLRSGKACGDDCELLRNLESDQQAQGAGEDFLCPDKTLLPVDYVCAPVLNDGERVGTTLIFRDSSQRQADAKLQRDAVAKLQQTIAELQAQLQAVHHNLREPLRTLEAECERLAARQPTLSEELAPIAGACQRLRSLLEDSQSYATAEPDEDCVEAVESTVVALNACVDAALAELRADIKKAAAQIDVAELPRATGNAAQLQRIFHHLLAYAIHRGGDGPPRIEVLECESVDRAYVTIVVRDQGPDIDAEQQQALFQIDGRANGNGAGLSLAVVKKLVESQGGKVRLQSLPGAGAEFRVKLRGVRG